MTKATVTLGGVALAGTSGLAWRITAGVAPYSTTVTVHESDAGSLRARLGEPLSLVVRDSRGVTTTIEHVYALHEVPSGSRWRASFVIADRRWKWSYKLVVRDFNVTRKTGNRDALGRSVPIETRVVVDRYDYLPPTLKPDGSRWTGRDAIEHVLEIVEPGAWTIESLPTGDGEAGQLTLQNVTLRDGGDAAIARLLSYIPGADVYVAPDGSVIVYDSLDLQAVRNRLKALPIATRAGEVVIDVKRAAIRPRRVRVHYTREVELLLSFRDSYTESQTVPNRDAPYLENVIPTPDPDTVVDVFDPETGTTSAVLVPVGTYVNISAWLESADLTKPAGSAPWTFEFFRAHWRNLSRLYRPESLDNLATASVVARLGALHTHFRQTFRVNPRYMRGIRELRAVRVGVLDPVTGARAPAGVWGQACYIASHKGGMIGRNAFHNVNHLEQYGSVPLNDTVTSPATVSIVDAELGIFRVDWLLPFAGTADSVIPCLLAGESGATFEASGAASRDLADQEERPYGFGSALESAATGIFLAPTMQLKVLLTVVPAAPNSLAQFHRIDVEADDVRALFPKDVGLADGDGPDLEVFVPPGEMTARWAMGDDDVAADVTARALFGFAGEIEGNDLPGYVLTNEGDGAGQGDRHLTAHSRALAAEHLIRYADAPMGAHAAVATGDALKLAGNLSGATLRVGQYPSAKVDVVHQFPGQQRPVSRFAYLPDSTRQQVLGTLPFR